VTFPFDTPTPEQIMSKLVDLETSLGTIRVELDDVKAPLSAANFIEYVKQGHYDGTIFHRVIKGFMIQGGGFQPGMTQKATGAQIPNEANNGLKNDHYTVAMARTSAPHSATAQFFVNTTDNGFLNFTSESSSGWGYAVFGKVIDGKDVVDAIEQVKTGRSGGHGDVPQQDVTIIRATLVD
jgi:peptidyl-prolyl cis-trans isomerase B (cyclophilin B)